MPGAVQVAEPVAVLLLRHLAEEFGAVGAQAGDGVVDVVDGEHDTMQAQSVGRRVRRSGADRRGAVAPIAAGLWYCVSSSLLWPSGVRIIAMTLRTPSSPTARSAQRPSICALPSRSHAKLGEEGDGGIQVFHDNADVVHPLTRHGGSPSSSRSPLWPLVHLGRSQHPILDK
jgi:hypothetical protein